MRYIKLDVETMPRSFADTEGGKLLNRSYLQSALITGIAVTIAGWVLWFVFPNTDTYVGAPGVVFVYVIGGGVHGGAHRWPGAFFNPVALYALATCGNVLFYGFIAFFVFKFFRVFRVKRTG